MFQRFERLVSHHDYGGFGLGPWIAREVVEAHGRSIEVWSEPGAGATFTVRLPRWSPTAAEAANAPELSASLGVEGVLRRPVDIDELLRFAQRHE